MTSTASETPGTTTGAWLRHAPPQHGSRPSSGTAQAYWYLIRFAGKSPLSFSAIDIKTYAMAMPKVPYREAAKRNMPPRCFDPLPHTHVALEQGALFCNMLRENRSG